MFLLDPSFTKNKADFPAAGKTSDENPHEYFIRLPAFPWIFCRQESVSSSRWCLETRTGGNPNQSRLKEGIFC